MGGISLTGGNEATSQGRFGMTDTSFLNGSGGQNFGTGSNFTTMVRYHFDEFTPFLDGHPFLYMEVKKYNGLDGTGARGVSATGLDLTAFRQEVHHSYGGGIGYQAPIPIGSWGEKSIYVGVYGGIIATNRTLSATSQEGTNLTMFKCSDTSLNGTAGGWFSGPIPGSDIFNWVLGYEWVRVGDATLSGTSVPFGNSYDYSATGVNLHTFTAGLSFRIGKLPGINY